MTPLRIAVMLGGCWVIPTFISFLPIMQGWNSIGIIDLVSSQGVRPMQCVGCWVFFKKQFSGKGKKKKENFPIPRCRRAAFYFGEFLEGIFKWELKWLCPGRTGTGTVVAWGRILPTFTPSSVRSPWKNGQTPTGPQQHLRSPWSSWLLQLLLK